MSNFPISLDNLTNPSPTSNQSVLVHSDQHATANDILESLEVSVGITNSADTDSLRYMQERLTTKGDILVHNGTNYERLPAGANGYMLVTDSTEDLGLKYIATTAGGTVTSVSVVSDNGFTGSVATATTTPAITLGTSITGLLKGNGTAISSATAGTDYLTPSGSGASLTDIFPVGMITPYAGTTAPTGWLICDGSAVSRVVTYDSLFAVISTLYGVGNGTTTFNIPDLRGRVAVGKSADTEFDTLGETGGEKTHTLTVAEMPAHNHGLATGTSGGTFYSHLDSSNNDGSGSWNANTNVDAGNYSTVTLVNGSGTAHNVIQPYQVINYIIKY